MIQPVFWVDACAFIEAKNRWYPFHLAPKFWSVLADEVESERIGCPSLVYKEIARGTDQLADWVKSRRSRLCRQESVHVQAAFGQIADHVQATYPSHQAADFLAGGDAWLIAMSRVEGGTVITGENHRRKRKVRIPEICHAFQVPCADIPQMLLAIGKPIS